VLIQSDLKVCNIDLDGFHPGKQGISFVGPPQATTRSSGLTKSSWSISSSHSSAFSQRTCIGGPKRPGDNSTSRWEYIVTAKAEVLVFAGSSSVRCHTSVWKAGRHPTHRLTWIRRYECSTIPRKSPKPRSNSPSSRKQLREWLKCTVHHFRWTFREGAGQEPVLIAQPVDGSCRR